MIHVPSQRHSRIRALILWNADMTDLELRSGSPYQPLYRISGSLWSDPLAGIDAWGWYALPAHFRPLCRLIFLTLISLRRGRIRIYLFFSWNGRVKNVARESPLRRSFRHTTSRHPLRGSALLLLPLRNFHGPFSPSSM